MTKLLGLLIFDHINDVIYIRCNQMFRHHIQKLAFSQGLITVSSNNISISQGGLEEGHSAQQDSSLEQECLDPNIVVQLFSPLVTSQRIMGSQFKNGYESIACDDGTTIVFQEYAGFLFLCIGSHSESYLQRFASISIQMVQLIVGPCVSLLKFRHTKAKLLDNLLSAWIELFTYHQSYLVEAIQRLILSPDISSTAIDVLSGVVNNLSNKKDVGSCHAMFFVRNKLLALYSSKNAEELSEADLLRLNLIVKAEKLKDTTFSSLDPDINAETPSPLPDEENEGVDSETEEEVTGEDLSLAEDDGTVVNAYNLLLKPNDGYLCPHVVYTYSVMSDLDLVIVIEVNRGQLASQLLEVLDLLEDLKNEQCNIKETPFVEVVDNCMRKAQDFLMWLPKGVYPKVKKNLIQVCGRWESLKKTHLEEWLRSSSDADLPSRLEASLVAILDAIRTTWRVACLDISPSPALKSVEMASRKARERMEGFSLALESSAIENLSLGGSGSIISINKYMEEFPGLVHFLYIDRTLNQLTAPMLQTDEETEVLSPERSNPVRHLTASKIWSMVDFAREHLARGHTSILWKDKTFSYSYFLWFEDQGSNPLKTSPIDKDTLEDLPLPGILCGDFYKAFAAKAFSGVPQGSLRPFELFCIHLGMTTSPCILEQTRRLAATVWEIAGPSSTNPMDLL